MTVQLLQAAWELLNFAVGPLKRAAKALQASRQPLNRTAEPSKVRVELLKGDLGAFETDLQLLATAKPAVECENQLMKRRKQCQQKKNRERYSATRSTEVFLARKKLKSGLRQRRSTNSE